VHPLDVTAGHAAFGALTVAIFFLYNRYLYARDWHAPRVRRSKDFYYAVAIVCWHRLVLQHQLRLRLSGPRSGWVHLTNAVFTNPAPARERRT